MASDPPGPTPAEGPDPYGNPDPEWLRVDWTGRIRQVDVTGHCAQLERPARFSRLLEAFLDS